MSDFAELISTVEQVRAERYPQLSSDLVRQVLTIEATQLDDRTAAMREIKQAVLAALASVTDDVDESVPPGGATDSGAGVARA